MNPNDLIKTTPALLKGAAEIIAAVPIADIVKRICSPSADFLGEKMKERVERCFEKTAKMTNSAGYIPQAVSPKLLLPILQGAAMEDDENLHTMWAALLANAALPENADKVRPGYIAILKEMAADEAILLKIVAELTDDYLSAWARSFPSKAALDAAKETANAAHMERIYESFATRDGESEPEARIGTCRVILENRGLIDHREVILLTNLGTAFLAACSPPKPKA